MRRDEKTLRRPYVYSGRGFETSRRPRARFAVTNYKLRIRVRSRRGKRSVRDAPNGRYVGSVHASRSPSPLSRSRVSNRRSSAVPPAFFAARMRSRSAIPEVDKSFWGGVLST